MANGYISGLQIDRIDNNGDYNPSNCRWVTPSKNCRNKRTNVLITRDGITKCLIEWAEYYGIPYKKFHHRLASG